MPSPWQNKKSLLAFSIALLCLIPQIQAQDIKLTTDESSGSATSSPTIAPYPYPTTDNITDYVQSHSSRWAQVVNNFDYPDPTNASTFLYDYTYRQQEGLVDGYYGNDTYYPNDTSSYTPSVEAPFNTAGFTTYTADGITQKSVNENNFTINGTNFAANGTFFMAMGVNFSTNGTNYTANGTNFTCTGQSFFAMGDHFNASGSEYYVNGTDFLASGTGYFVSGERFQASGSNYSVYGQNYTASGDNFTAMGSHFNLTGTNISVYGSNYTLNGVFYNETNINDLINQTTASGGSDSTSYPKPEPSKEEYEFQCYFRDLSNYTRFIAAVDYLTESNSTYGYQNGQYFSNYSGHVTPFTEFGDNYTFQWSLEGFYQGGWYKQNPCWLQNQMSRQSMDIWNIFYNNPSYQSRYMNFYPVYDKSDNNTENSTITSDTSVSTNSTNTTDGSSSSTSMIADNSTDPTKNYTNDSYIIEFQKQQALNAEEFRRLVPVGQDQSRILNISSQVLKSGSFYSFSVDVRRKNESGLTANTTTNTSDPYSFYNRDPYVFKGYTYVQFMSLRNISDFSTLFPNRGDASAAIIIDPILLDIAVPSPQFTVTYDFSVAAQNPIVSGAATTPTLSFRLRRLWEDFDESQYIPAFYLTTDKNITWPSGNIQIPFTEKEVGAVPVRFEFILTVGDVRYAITKAAGILGLDYSQVQAISNKFAEGADLSTVTFEDIALGLASLATEFGGAQTAQADSSQQASATTSGSGSASTTSQTTVENSCRASGSNTDCSGNGKCVDGKNGIKKCDCNEGFGGKFCGQDAAELKTSQDKLKNIIGAISTSSFNDDAVRQSVTINLRQVTQTSIIDLDIAHLIGDKLVEIGKQAESIEEISGLLDSFSDIALTVSSSDSNTAEDSKKILGQLTGLTGKSAAFLQAGESQEQSKPTFVAKTVKLGGSSGASLSVASTKGVIQNGIELPAPSVDIPTGSLPANADSVTLVSVSPILAGSIVGEKNKGVLTQLSINDASGNPLEVKGLQDGSKIKVVVTLSSSSDSTQSSTQTVAFECVYFDEASNTWKTDGVKLDTSATNAGSLSCETEHLTMFSVQTASPATNTNSEEVPSYGYLLGLFVMFALLAI